MAVAIPQPQCDAVKSSPDNQNINNGSRHPRYGTRVSPYHVISGMLGIKEKKKVYIKRMQKPPATRVVPQFGSGIVGRGERRQALYEDGRSHIQPVIGKTCALSSVSSYPSPSNLCC